MNQRIEYIDNLFVTTWRNVKRLVSDAIFQINPFVSKLVESGKIKRSYTGGRYIDVDVEYAKLEDQIKWFDRGDTFDIGDKEFLTQMSYPWRYLGTTVVRYWTDEQKNRGKAKLYDYVKRKISNTQASLASRLEHDLFHEDSSGKGIYTIPQLISTTPTTGTIAGLDRSQNTWMANETEDFSSYTFDTDFVSRAGHLLNNISKWKANGLQRKPDIIITTQEIYEAYEALAEELRIIVRHDSPQVSLGMGDMALKGIPIYWIPECPEGRVYILSTNFLEFAVDPIADFEMQPWSKIPLTADRVAEILAACQLIVTNFRKQGVMYNVEVS